jgi:2-methylcitrate dehydratase
LLSEDIAEFVAGVRCDRLPGSTIDAVKVLVLDTLGCALGALDAEPAALLKAIAPNAAPGGPGATCIGDGRFVTTEGAVIVNGALVRYLDFMDVYWSRDICHPAENITVALACVEETKGDGARLIEAIVGGYETQIRLCDSFSFQDMGFHHASAAGFVAPLIAGKAWGQDKATMAQGSVLGGFRHLTLGVLSSGDLSMAKAGAFPMSSSEGVTAARLAAAGFTGPLSAFEWMYKQTGADVADFALDYDSYRLERVSLKQFPAQYALQAPVAAAVRLHGDVAGKYENIQKIRAMVKPEMLVRAADPSKYHPANRETADHSLPSCVSMALLDGKLTEAQFTENRFLDDDVMALTGLVECVGDTSFAVRFPDGRPGAVEVVFTNGDVVSAVEEVPLGDRDRPMGQAALHQKFMDQAAPEIGDAAATRIIAFIDDLENQTSIAPLLQLCRREPS